MTYDERQKFYEKVENTLNLIFKQSYPKLCKVSIYEDNEGPQIKIHIMEDDTPTDLHDVSILSYRIYDFVRNYFNIKVMEVSWDFVDNCE